MATISAVLIVKNEELTLAQCLASLEWVDEIIVLDSGSDDDTVAIANRFTDKIFVNKDWQGFGLQRQRAQQHASSDWVFMIDADERVTSELQQEIKAVVARAPQHNVYRVPILPWCFGRFIRHSGWYPAYKIRLYPRLKARYGDERVHEKLRLDDGLQKQTLKGDLLHFTYRDMRHYLVKSANYADEWAQERKLQGRKASLLQGVVHGAGCFIKMYLVKRGFLDGAQGFLLAMLSAHSTFVKYADLWTRDQGAPPKIKPINPPK